MKKITTGTVKVEATPEGAEVFIDSKYRGVSPGAWKIEEGPHTIMVAADNHKKHQETVEVVAGQTLSLEAALRKIGHGVLVIRANPWADVYVNGEKVGTTPPTVEWKVEEGDVEVSLRNPSFQPFTRRYTIAVDERLKVAHTFKDEAPINNKEKRGKIKIVSPKATGTVFIDGIAKGTTPLVVDSLQEGDHALVVKRPGHPDFKRKITVKAGVTIRVEVP
jgi:hypothetical protein